CTTRRTVAIGRLSPGVPTHEAGAGDAQQRGEVADLAAQLRHLVVERADEARRRHALAGRDVVEDRPEHRFQTDARAMALEADRARDDTIACRILIGKDPTHELSSLRPGDRYCRGTTRVLQCAIAR